MTVLLLNTLNCANVKCNTLVSCGKTIGGTHSAIASLEVIPVPNGKVDKNTDE